MLFPHKQKRKQTVTTKLPLLLKKKEKKLSSSQMNIHSWMFFRWRRRRRSVFNVRYCLWPKYIRRIIKFSYYLIHINLCKRTNKQKKCDKPLVESTVQNRKSRLHSNRISISYYVMRVFISFIYNAMHVVSSNDELLENKIETQLESIDSNHTIVTLKSNYAVCLPDDSINPFDFIKIYTCFLIFCLL